MGVFALRASAVLVLLVVLSGQAFAAGEYGLPKGIGQTAWGDDLSRAKNFMKLKSVDGVDYYVNMGQAVEFKGYGKPTVFYAANGGKLYAVHIRLDEASAAKLRADLVKTYGQGKQTTEGAGNITSWKAGQVRLKLKTSAGQELKLSVYYRPLIARMALEQAFADPGSSAELARLLPAGESQQKTLGDQTPTKAKETRADIDLGKFLGFMVKR